MITRSAINLPRSFNARCERFQSGPISTLKDWNSTGRYVKRGEKAIWLCMPITGKKTGKDQTTGEERTEHYTFFGWKPRWFVLAQTEGEEYKPDAVTNVWARAKALEALNIEEWPFEMIDGNCQGYSQQRAIAINPIAVNSLKTTICDVCGEKVLRRMLDCLKAWRKLLKLLACY
jgi:hypothetical protein